VKEQNIYEPFSGRAASVHSCKLQDNILNSRIRVQRVPADSFSVHLLGMKTWRASEIRQEARAGAYSLHDLVLLKELVGFDPF
jgi:hypothetical protein